MDCEALDASLVYIIYRTIYPYREGQGAALAAATEVCKQTHTPQV